MPRKSPTKPEDDASRQTPLLSNELPNDVASLESRRDRRAIHSLQAVNLVISLKVKKSSFYHSFNNRTSLSDTLVRQCVFAAEISLQGRDVSLTVVQDSYLGISEFLDFCESINNGASKIYSFSDIGIQTGRDFLSWYLREYPGRSVNRKRYGKVRAIISDYKKKYKDAANVGALLVWPPGPPTTDNPTVGYTRDDLNLLVEAALSDIKSVMKAMLYVENNLDKWAQIIVRSPTISDACLAAGIWERDAVDGNRYKFPSDRYSALTNLKVIRDACKAISIENEEFLRVYRENGDELARNGTIYPSYARIRGKGGKTFSGMTLLDSQEIAIKTFSENLPHWPLGMHVKDASELVCFSDAIKLGDGIYPAYEVLQGLSFGDKSNPMENGLMAYISRFFFTSATLYPFFLYVQQNTGWNAEAILSIGCDLDEHISPDLIDPSYVVIWGWKGKTESVVQHRSNTKSPYSVYSVLRFVEKIANKMGMTSEVKGGSLWKYVLAKNLWTKFNKTVQALDCFSVGTSSAKFLARHGILLDSVQKQKRVDSKRMRTSVQTRRRESGYSIFESSSQMGHSSTDTTWNNYDAEPHAYALKNERLRKVQGTLISDIEGYSSRLIECSTLQALRAEIEKGYADSYQVEVRTGLTKEQVINLLSPGGQTYIAGCVDRKNPTWERAADFLSDGESCNFFNKCCLCRNSRIFSEALPFIYRRVRDLDSLKRELLLSDWLENYGDEYEAWIGIISDWSDKEQLRDAERLSFLEKYSLPFNMRGLN